jgi:hypothetical protein
MRAAGLCVERDQAAGQAQARVGRGVVKQRAQRRETSLLVEGEHRCPGGVAGHAQQRARHRQPATRSHERDL